MWEYSKPVDKELWALRMPILVSYASKDVSSPYCDLLQINAIRDKKSNIHFRCQIHENKLCCQQLLLVEDSFAVLDLRQ